MKFPAFLEPTMRENLNVLIGAYAEAKGHSVRTVARRFADDDRFLERINGGGAFTVAMYDRVVARLARAWPADAKWPEKIHRPTTTQTTELIGDGA